MNNRKKVVIVGAKFGELYLNAFIESHPEFELAGILAQGSQRSKNLAIAFGIPLYQRVSQLPQDITIACVVIRASVIGGVGNLLVEELLKRKIHVLQEHPVSAKEIQRHLTLAEQCGVQYRVNSFYSACRAGQTLISSAQQITEQALKSASHGNFTTSRQLLYSTLDILLLALRNGGPLKPTLLGKQRQFDLINLQSEQGEYLLQLQNYLDPQDPDMHNLAMHRIMLGWDAGYLSMVDSYGPIHWTPVLHADHHLSDQNSLYQAVSSPEGQYLNQPTTQVLYHQPNLVKDLFEELGPEGVLFTLEQFCHLIDGQIGSHSLTQSHQLNVAQLWEDILTLCGQPQEKAIPPSPRISLQAFDTQHNDAKGGML
ncbi:Gfo/Idh/MocA family oxidoreductase [Vibrio mimicus]